MGEVRFGVHDVAGIRFAISPLWETLASFRAASDPGRHAVHLPWIKPALALREDRALAARIAPLHTAAASPGFVTPPPRCPLAEFEEELALTAAAPELGEALRAWWEAAVRPYWPRVRAVLEADIAYRTRQLAEDGIQEVFARLHPALRWTGDRLVSPDLPPAGLDLGGAGITLAPSAFAARCHLLTGPGPAPPAAVYPSRAVGGLWERRSACGDGLARLLGRSRARLLAFTSSPSTTTQLAARSGLSLGAVSQHLSVLRDAGLVTSHRYRREVHYTASDLGTALLDRA
ncbi:helix-turn-helix domain-containing protein [Streptomyces sp. NBC_00091]|uniref:ArsR/SmtB family transcription factor n=1 Tax=Streptomyces sp. NBC_00091 TaxID=2975648 RepID=UPI002251DDA3|nr:helix-turn-helix domain-containing protein [Streptomyces sp. NBC_00091]MCX5380565.1 winged helix-turn-helix domain-containing protein [Streptomyces sp. NBC_00091]